MAKHLRKEERRQQLTEAALKAFGKRGYPKTQISHIIAEAGVARGTFYLYFEGKREIFDAIVTEISEKVLTQMRPIKKEKLSEIPEQIIGNIQRVTELLLNNPLYVKIFFSDAVGLDDEFDDRLRKFYQNILENIRRGLKQGQEMGLVRAGDVQILSLCLLGILKEVFYQFVLGTELLAPEKIVEEIYRTVLHAVIRPELIAKMTGPANVLRLADPA